MSLITQLSHTPKPPEPPSLRSKAEDVLKKGDDTFQERISNATLTPDEHAMVSAGSYSVGLVIDPPHPGARPDQTFSTIIASSNPKLTGWPMWLDSSGFTEPKSRPKRRGNSVETLIFSSGDSWSKHLDFARIDPRGEFFQRRILQDDAVDKVEPRTVLDPILVIIRVAEIIAVGLAFAKALGWGEEARLGFAFRWRGLTGRHLTPWANFFVNAGGGTSYDDEVGAFTEVPGWTPQNAIAPYVEQVVGDVFVLFDGYVMSSPAIEEWSRRLVERRLNF